MTKSLHKIHTMVEFPFYGDNLSVVRNAEDGSGWVSVKDICVLLNIDHKAQLRKTAEDPRFNCRSMTTVAADGKQREMTMISVEDVHYFLSTINPNKLSANEGESDGQFQERLAKLVVYQKECGVALRDYWLSGFAVNPRDHAECTRIDAKFNDFRTASRTSLINAVKNFAAYAVSKGVQYDKDDLYHGILNIISGHVIGRKLIHEDEMLSGAEQKIINSLERVVSSTLIHYVSWEKNPENILHKVGVHIDAFIKHHPVPLGDANVLSMELFASWEDECGSYSTALQEVEEMVPHIIV